MKACIGVLLVLAGCAKAPVAPSTVINTRKWVEDAPLPPHPKTLPLPEGLRTEDERVVMPVDEGMCDPAEGGYEPPCPEMSGILISEARANRDALFRIQYEELRNHYEQDRAVWTAHRSLYEKQLAIDAEYLKRAAPTFWEEHDGQILGIVGFGVGAAVVLGLAKALDGGD